MPLSPPNPSWQPLRRAGKRTARSATPRSCASVRARRSSIEKRRRLRSARLQCPGRGTGRSSSKVPLRLLRNSAAKSHSPSTPEAWAIVERRPRTSDYIFPYDPKSVGTAFTRATRLLGIVDLRFHDLRHEATSRLFERGYQIHEVAQFTQHDSWNELKRYANLRPENLRDISTAPRRLRATADTSAGTGRSRCLTNSHSSSIDQLGEVGRTDEPGRLPKYLGRPLPQQRPVLLDQTNRHAGIARIGGHDRLRQVVSPRL